MIEALFRDFRYYPVVICGSGTSFNEAQAALIRQRRADNACRVIVVNNQYRAVPNADILYAADHAWWKCHCKPRACDGQPGVTVVAPNVHRFSCEARILQDFPPAHVVHVQGSRGIALEKDKHGKPINHIARGSGGGFQSFGLAVKLGARNIILVGMDCKRGPNGESHNHGDHPKRELPNPQPHQMWADEWDSLLEPAQLRGIRLVNCTIDTAIRRLPRSTLEEELWSHENRSDDVAPGDALPK